MNQQFIRAELDDFDYDVFFKIQSFTISIIKGTFVANVEIQNIGNKFNEKIEEALKNITENDIMIFKDINVKYPDGRKCIISPIVFLLLNNFI